MRMKSGGRLTASATQVARPHRASARLAVVVVSARRPCSDVTTTTVASDPGSSGGVQLLRRASSPSPPPQPPVSPTLALELSSRNSWEHSHGGLLRLLPHGPKPQRLVDGVARLASTAAPASPPLPPAPLLASAAWPLASAAARRRYAQPASSPAHGRFLAGAWEPRRSGSEICGGAGWEGRNG